ncbi:MBL fold metallo-hydrolase [Anoxybacillus sp. ST4]|uniref:MBL fold metallo-hydrolase n=1 Tax=unclassified Anoxybacillus TaxID=2639704 RepID=UPI001C642B46|nr:MBL fold metallo-hydrolase [Anoxybacillus sp. ST4]MBW7652283.1 MBL fold metallo-hydrolase [Anoxybacillus sp. ST4]
MLVKKKFEQETVSGVHIAKGTLTFQGVRLTVHCFSTDGVLIDTGAASLANEFAHFFKSLDIDQVMITHFHEDHTGCAAFLQNERQLPIYMNELMIDYCRKQADYPIYRKFFWGTRPPFQAKPIENMFSTRHATWDVIHTPGHAVDHLAFLNRETGQLFTGDLYCLEKTKVILREESISTLIDSLKKVLTYDFREMFCAHAGYVKDGRTALQRKLHYLQELQGKIIDLYEKGATLKQIQSILFPKKYPITFLSLGEWSSFHIVRSVIEEHHMKKISER